MDTLENIKKTPRELFAFLCKMTAKEDWGVARDIADELANLGAPGTWLELAYDLADGLKVIFQASENVFSLEEELSANQTELIIEAQEWVSNKLGLEIPTLVFELTSNDDGVHAITGINGFGLIIINEESLKEKSLLVHEITHCTLMSRSLFLDEGLATIFQNSIINKNVILEEDYWDRPSIASLIESDWSNDPYFTHVVPVGIFNLGAPVEGDDKMHRLSAYLVQLLIDAKSIDYVVAQWSKLKPQLKDGRTAAVFQKIFGVNLWEIDANFISELNPIALIEEEKSFLDITTKALMEGDKIIVNPYLPTLRVKAFKSNDDLVALIKTLILLSFNDKDENKNKLFHTEALVAMDWAKDRGCNEKDLKIFDAYKYVFKLKGAAHVINIRKLGTQTSEAFEKLIKEYPNDPEVIITCAKAQKVSYYDMLSIEEWRGKLNDVVNKKDPLFYIAAKKLLNDPKYLLEN